MTVTVQDFWRRTISHPKIQAPVTLRAMCAGVCWRVAECGAAVAAQGARNNLLNTTRALPGATDFNSAGVKDYTSAEQGVWATVLSLTNGHYDEVLELLRAGASAPEVLAAVGRSPWGTSFPSDV